MIGRVVISPAMRGTILSLNRAQDVIDATTLRLASGLKVSSAIQGPQNFFTAMALNNRAKDLENLLDNINQNVRVIQEAITGAEALSRLIDQTESVVLESKARVTAGETDPAIYTKTITTIPISLDSQILSGSPDVYFRLDDPVSPLVDYGSGGGVVANYAGGVTGGAPALFTNNPNLSTDFDGINDRVNVNDSLLINGAPTNARTVELIFNADTTAGRQVLYEEGGANNGFTIYIDSGLIRVTGEDTNGAETWVDADISAPIVAGQTYHVAFVYNAATDSFSGYLDGALMGSVSTGGASDFPTHTGNIGIGAAPDAVQFHDGFSGAGGFRFNGRISNVAIYNRALSQQTLQNHALSEDPVTIIVFRNSEYESLLEQIDMLVQDAQYRGNNLLSGEDLTTYFNESRTSKLITKGVKFSASGLGINLQDFDTEANIDKILETVRAARKEIRTLTRTLAYDLAIIQIRSEFTENLINTLKAGADDLTVSDQNEDGASLLASQTRQALGTVALRLAAGSQAAILPVISGSA